MRPLELSGFLLEKIIKRGSHVVDATAGNGHDALRLAKLVGSSGSLDIFDIQKEAIDSTRNRLENSGLELGQVRYWQIGHERMEEVIFAPNGLQAVVFNLGYFPGADKSLVTKTATTLCALEQAKRLISLNGVLSVMCYPAHFGGSDEAESVRNWASNLVEDGWEVSEFSQLGKYEFPKPFLIFAQKKTLVAEKKNH